MLNSKYIQDILTKEEKPLSLNEITFLVNKSHIDLRNVSISTINDIIKKNSQIFKEKGNTVQLIKSKNSALLDLDFNEYEDNLIDAFLHQLYSSFNNNDVPEVAQHFSTLVLFDRLLSPHFNNNTELKDISSKFSAKAIYNSYREIDDYLSHLKRLNQYPALQDSLKGVIKLLDGKRTEAIKQAYYRAFNACLEFKSYKFDPINFGKKFNSYLAKSRVLKNTHTLQSTPEFISKLIAHITNVNNSSVLYDPAIGIGSIFVEIAHAKSIYDFNVVGMDLNWGTVIVCKINLLINRIYKFNVTDGDSFMDNEILDNSVDIAISNPPFGNPPTSLKLRSNFTHEFEADLGTDFSSLFISLMIKKTNKQGKILTVVSDSTLFAKHTNQLRHYLVDKNLLESVYSLPFGLYYPISAAGSCLISIDKKANKDNVSFFNARNTLKIQIKNKFSSFSKNDIEQFFKVLNDEAHGKQENSIHMQIPKAFANKKTIIENDYDLTPARYTHQVLSDIAKIKQNGTPFVSLSEILFNSPIKNTKNEIDAWPFIKIKDLRRDNSILHYSKIKDLSPPNGKESLTGRILDKSALLIARVGSDLKPTILSLNEGEKVILNGNIHYFFINKNRVNEEYLIAQLNSDLVKEQAELYRTKVAAESLSKERFLKIEIPLPPIIEQLEWVSKNLRRTAEKDELTSFIKAIPLIETSQDLKNEIERFAVSQFTNAEKAEFKRYLEYDKFPFSNTEIENFVRAKKTKDFTKTLIALENDENGIFGALEVDDENPIDLKKVHTVNVYSSFLIKIYDFLTKSSINRQLDAFAHTSRNFFFKLQGELDLLLKSKNDNFQNIMNTTYVETDLAINHYIKQGTKKKEEFLLKNQLLSIKNQTSAQFQFYDQIHKLYTEIKNTESSVFYIKELLEEINRIENNNLIIKPVAKLFVLGKETLIKHALLDLVRNAIKYSTDGSCNIEVNDKINSIVIVISNKVNEIIEEDKYNMLGQTWLKDNSNGEDRISCGIYNAFQMIRESFGKANLIEYGNYKHTNVFKVLIQLKKYE